MARLHEVGFAWLGRGHRLGHAHVGRHGAAGQQRERGATAKHTTSIAQVYGGSPKVGGSAIVPASDSGNVHAFAPVATHGSIAVEFPLAVCRMTLPVASTSSERTTPNMLITDDSNRIPTRKPACVGEQVGKPWRMRSQQFTVLVLGLGLASCAPDNAADDEATSGTSETGTSETGTNETSTNETSTSETDSSETDSSETGELPEQTARLRVVNACEQPMWVLAQVGSGGGTLDAPNQVLLAERGDFVDYPIPDIGLAATRFWPGFGCDATGNDCSVGQSGGPASEGFTCPPEGCAPAIDSKFEGTFGCLPSVDPSTCQDNPSAPGVKLPASDGWDTSMVDGFTVAYTVELLDDCPGGPQDGRIDCSGLRLADCPISEDLSTNDQFPSLDAADLVAHDPSTNEVAGCYSPCGKLTYSNWGNTPTFAPDAAEAAYYCCPTPPIGVDDCRTGPVVDTHYVELIHQQCPQVYSYAYDDGIGNWSCPAGTRYQVTFFCPQ